MFSSASLRFMEDGSIPIRVTIGAAKIQLRKPLGVDKAIAVRDRALAAGHCGGQMESLPFQL
jgi:hypothetical protein